MEVHTQKVSEVVKKLREMYAQGMDTRRLAIDLIEIIKDVLIYSDQGKENLLSRLSEIEAQDIMKLVSTEELLKDARNLEEDISRERQNANFLSYLELSLIQMANNTKAQSSASPIKKSENKEPVSEDKTETEVAEEKTQSFVIEPENDLLLAILLDANRDLKIADQIIYNKLVLYQYEPEKRKFYQLLINTELFASNKDAIIICGNRMQADNINTKAINEDLYRFINKEFGIDKMIYGIDEQKKKELIDLYRKAPAEMRHKPVYIEKYKFEKEKEESTEDTLKNIFGDSLKIEE